MTNDPTSPTGALSDALSSTSGNPEPIEEFLAAVDAMEGGYGRFTFLEGFLTHDLDALKLILEDEDHFSFEQREFLQNTNRKLLPFVPRLDHVAVSEENDGEPFWIVFRLDDKFYRFEGVFSSWDEVSYDGTTLQEVAQVEKTRVIVEKVWEPVRTGQIS